MKMPATAPGGGGVAGCRRCIAGKSSPEEPSSDSRGVFELASFSYTTESAEVGWGRPFPERRRSRILTEQCRKFFVLVTISAVEEKSWWRMVRMVKYVAPSVPAASSREMKTFLGEFWIGTGNSVEPSRRHA